MGVSSYDDSNANYSSSGSQWICPKCKKSVTGSHICYTIDPGVVNNLNTVWPPQPALTDAEMRELLELIRELHAVIFTPRREREIDKLARDEEEHDKV